MGEQLYFVVDLRREWTKNPYITLWRPDSAGYAYPLPWAGRYTESEIIKSGSYHTCRRYLEKLRDHVGVGERFAVRCEDIEALATDPDTEGCGRIDGNTGPVVRNSGAMRLKLRRLRFELPDAVPSPAQARGR
ncbi:hypothetical protein [Methylobacterium brachythecii]|uniref:Uncharacterized protein n=1 Tax=Methylobacterium brachythecii TaxID=1176177 RepID=A0A7W6F674_9HYPH|nr:hypothetical protein [Methylobacterium brachythecii]MBB3902075.1 hypothetical protein [Methylobacterium brachythecii]GLS44472.1 hypothetical protein GCM10007884_24600 [Methylobacterium brachythecii]